MKKATLLFKDSLKEHIQKEHDFLNKVRTEGEGCGVFVNCIGHEKAIVAYKRISMGKAAWNVIINLPYGEISVPIHKNARNNFGYALFLIILYTVWVSRAGYF